MAVWNGSWSCSRCSKVGTSILNGGLCGEGGVDSQAAHAAILPGKVCTIYLCLMFMSCSYENVCVSPMITTG